MKSEAKALRPKISFTDTQTAFGRWFLSMPSCEVHFQEATTYQGVAKLPQHADSFSHVHPPAEYLGYFGPRSLDIDVLSYRFRHVTFAISRGRKDLVAMVQLALQDVERVRC